MEYLFEYVKRNTKYAAKSVFLNFKGYIPFFAALFIIQCVFFTLFITTATNVRNTENQITENFDYDVVISGLDYNQSIEVERNLYIQSFMKKRTFESYRIEQASLEEGGDYRIYVLMREDSDLEVFIEYYINNPLGDAKNVRVSTTPLYSYKSSSNSFSESPPFILIAAICAVSVAAVIAIYSVRINNQKFMYGIYITFGADLKKLISTAVFEMMLLALLAFLPSAALTYLFAYLAYSPFGIAPVVKAEIFIKVLASVLVVSIAGAYLPMKMVSRKTPLSLLSADDNSNLCSSPAKSAKILGKVFPKNYEMLSLWRFRKYYVKLLLSSVIFTSVFICGFYISDMFTMNIEEPVKEFVITNSSEASEEEQADDIDFLYGKISEYDFADGITWDVSTPASLLNSFVLTSNDSTRKASGLIASTVNISCISEEMQSAYEAYGSENITSVTNSMKYAAFNETSLSYIEKNFDIEGDLYSILENENTVIVSEDVYNSQKFSFKVGDKIIVAKHLEAYAVYDGDYFDTVGVLQHLLEKHSYEFYEFTVGAVVKNYGDSEGYFTVGFSESDYSSVTGASYIPKAMSILLSSDADSADAEKLNDELVSLFYYMGSDYRLSRTYEILDRDIVKQENQRVFAILISSLVVVMSPVVWFFSQTMFFNKRKKELFVLRAFGAKEESISGMFKYSGIVMSAAGFLLATLMSLPASYLIYMTMNTWLPSLGFFNSGIYYKFYLSPAAVAICALLSASAGFLAAWIPYKLSVRKMNKAYIKNEYEGSDE